jgi:hypothetical protein
MARRAQTRCLRRNHATGDEAAGPWTEAASPSAFAPRAIANKKSCDAGRVVFAASAHSPYNVIAGAEAAASGNSDAPAITDDGSSPSFITTRYGDRNESRG